MAAAADGDGCEFAHPIGRDVIIQPVPYGRHEYHAYVGRAFRITARRRCAKTGGAVYDMQTSVATGVGWTGPGPTVLRGVPEEHLQLRDVLVSASMDCVQRLPLDGFLRSVRRFVVPLFQRKYCWGEAQWRGIWRDAAPTAAQHSMGRITLYEELWQERPQGVHAADRINDPVLRRGRTLVVVDGQQRLTTLTLYLAAVRDVLAEHAVAGADDAPAGGSKAAAAARTCIARINALVVPEGRQVLLPTEDDRDAYARCVRDKDARAVTVTAVSAPPASPAESKITQCYEFFAALARRCVAEADVWRLCDRVDDALSRVILLYFELDDGLAVARFFEQLHIREKMIATQLHNEAPGVDLAEYDLLRNFLLGHFKAEATQVEVYKTLWLEVERAAGAEHGDMELLTECLRQFLDVRLARAPRRRREKPKQASMMPSFTPTPLEPREESLYKQYQELLTGDLHATFGACGQHEAGQPSPAGNPGPADGQAALEARVRGFLEDMLASVREAAPRIRDELRTAERAGGGATRRTAPPSAQALQNRPLLPTSQMLPPREGYGPRIAARPPVPSGGMPAPPPPPK